MNNLPIASKIAADARVTGRGIMGASQFGDVIAGVAIILLIVVAAAIQAVLFEQMPGTALSMPSAADFSTITGSLAARESLRDDMTAEGVVEKDQARLDQVKVEQVGLEQVDTALTDGAGGADYPYPLIPLKRNLAYLGFYIYSEVPIEKPADIVLDQIKDIPVGTPIEEIRHASDAFGMNFSFMKAVAKIESDFDPKQKTGSYIGLFQLSHYEFAKFGSGDILSARDNAIAAAYKFIAEATMFEWWARKRPTINDLYLIHQQGWQGAAEHIAHPERIAWRSMCATDEGKEKGEKWCKRAVWGNTLPTIKHIWKSVDNLTSGEFVGMWRQRLNMFYARYSEAEAVTK